MSEYQNMSQEQKSQAWNDTSFAHKFKVYIASPYTIGDVAVNVKLQLDTVDELMNHGFAPFAPLYSHFQHMAHPRPYQDWIEIDKVWVLACDCLLRLPGESNGADAEKELATQLGKPVFYDVESLVRYYDKPGTGKTEFKIKITS
jgi:hypothetical protein